MHNLYLLEGIEKVYISSLEHRCALVSQASPRANGKSGGKRENARGKIRLVTCAGFSLRNGMQLLIKSREWSCYGTLETCLSSHDYVCRPTVSTLYTKVKALGVNVHSVKAHRRLSVTVGRLTNTSVPYKRLHSQRH